MYVPKVYSGKNRTFFFFNFERVLDRSPDNITATVPTALQRIGDFSQSVARGPVSVFDSTTGLPFPGNRIPVSRLNPASLGLLPLIPLPNQPGAVQNYQVLSSIPNNSNNFNLTLNRTLTRKDRLNGSFALPISALSGSGCQIRSELSHRTEQLPSAFNKGLALFPRTP